MSEHVLVRMARSLGAPPDQQARVAMVAARVEAEIDAACAVEDPAQAAVVLPEAVLALYREVMPLFSSGLLPGVEWINLQHRVVHARAVRVLGPEQRAVEACAVEPIATPARGGGPRSPFGL